MSKAILEPKDKANGGWYGAYIVTILIQNADRIETFERIAMLVAIALNLALDDF